MQDEQITEWRPQPKTTSTDVPEATVDAATTATTSSTPATTTVEPASTTALTDVDAAVAVTTD